MFLGWAPVNGSFAVVVFCRLSRVYILVAPSVYMGGNDWRGRGVGGPLLLVRVAIVAVFRGVCGFGWCRLGGGAFRVCSVS